MTCRPNADVIVVETGAGQSRPRRPLVPVAAILATASIVVAAARLDPAILHPRPADHPPFAVDGLFDVPLAAVQVPGLPAPAAVVPRLTFTSTGATLPTVATVDPHLALTPAAAAGSVVPALPVGMDAWAMIATPAIPGERRGG
ncbi:MAG: hypothetical protein ACXWUN_08395 [Allosphingosinicella sp.]